MDRWRLLHLHGAHTIDSCQAAGSVLNVDACKKGRKARESETGRCGVADVEPAAWVVRCMVGQWVVV
jgi:hypothetical protein